MAKKGRHHYLPQFYLESFTSPLIQKKPILYLYEKGNEQIRKVTPDKAGVIKGYYSIEQPGLDIDQNIVESILSIVESQSAPVIKKIRNREELDDGDRTNFSVFLGYMLTRTPHHRKATEALSAEALKFWLMGLASNKEGFEDTIKRYERDTGKEIEYPVEKLRNFILDENSYDIKAHPNVSLAFMHMGIEYAPLFLDMKWSFWEATSDYKYVTSDNPLYYFDRTAPPNLGVGLANKNIEPETCVKIS
jgi:hypothetical protein